MGGVQVTYAPRANTTAEAELSALANVYKFVLESHAKKRGRLPNKNGPDDAKESKNGVATGSIPRGS